MQFLNEPKILLNSTNTERKLRHGLSLKMSNIELNNIGPLAKSIEKENELTTSDND